MFNPVPHLPLTPVLAALPAGSTPLAGTRRPLFLVPVDGGWTTYTPDGAGFRTFGELVYADRDRLAHVMGDH